MSTEYHSLKSIMTVEQAVTKLRELPDGAEFLLLTDEVLDAEEGTGILHVYAPHTLKASQANIMLDRAKKWVLR